MIEEMARRLGRSRLGSALSRPLPIVGQPLLVALQQAGLDPAVAVGALRLLADRRVRWVRPSVLARLAADVARRGRSGQQGLLRLHALNSPEAPALVVGSGAGALRLSYAQLEARVCRIAWSLQERGVRPGDRVALMLPNGVEQIEVPAALLWLGARVVQVGWRLKPREVGHVLADSGARALVFHAAHAQVIGEALDAAEPGARPDASLCFMAGSAAAGDAASSDPAARGARRHVPYNELLDGAARDEPPLPSGGGYGGVIIYTSGTTGRPKGASRDFREMGMGPVVNFIADLPLREDERHLLVCPLYHSAGAFFASLALGIGGTLVIPGGAEHFDAEGALAAIERERITSVALVPTMFQRLLALGPQALRRHDLSSLRWVMSVAAPLPTDLARRVEDALGPILYNFYAATETGVVTLARPGEHTARPGTIGRAVLGCDVRLLDEAGRDVPTGEVGELWVRSAMLVGGYHGNAAATAAATRDGYFSVGDLARADADGYYYLVDRRSDMVISGGVNIYPWEIEQRLHAHEAVVDCAVVGVPDPDWGESLVAFVVLRPGQRASVEELQRFVAEELADYKRPRRVVFVDELPRNLTGKILKRELRERLATSDAPH